ncbi:MAG TPA: hypothetical protein VHT02_04365, partial [Methylocella sp.]|nr:hypothetical protein [Methylocella sp.]
RTQLCETERNFINFSNKAKQFDDIRKLADFHCGPLSKALDDFSNALKALGDASDAQFLISPYSTKVEDAIRELNEWPGVTSEKILALRKQLSK